MMPLACAYGENPKPPPPPGRYTQAACFSSKSHRERDDDYEGVVVRLSERWRVAVCKDRVQWILQRRDTAPSHRGYWRGRSYHVQRDSLISACVRCQPALGQSALEMLRSLPARFPRPSSVITAEPTD